MSDWIMKSEPRTADTRLRGFRWPPTPGEARRLAARELVTVPHLFADDCGHFRASQQNQITHWCRAIVRHLDDGLAVDAWESEGGQ